MKTRIKHTGLKPVPIALRFLWTLCFCACVAAWACAQTPPVLGLQLSAGQPALSITGTVGIVYSIQYASDLSPAGHWTARTLIQVQGASTVWTDPAARTQGQ